MHLMELAALCKDTRAAQKDPAACRTFYGRDAKEACLALEKRLDDAVARLTAPPSEEEFAIQQMVSEGGRDAPIAVADAPCYLCGEPTDSVAGNPGLWPLQFCAPDGTGVCRWWHSGCVMAQLAEVGRLKALVASLQGRGEKQP